MPSFLPYSRQEINDADISAVNAILRSDFLTCGPAVEEFEKALADEVVARYAIVCSSGTAALHLTCLAAGIKKGDAVFIPALTFAATANCVLYCGGTPVFIDIEPSTKGICPLALANAIKTVREHGLRPAAVIPVHYAGLPCQIQRVIDIARENKLLVIEDACHALGALYRSQIDDDWHKVGSSYLSDMTIFSFHAFD